jgi:hypothetical protein
VISTVAYYYTVAVSILILLMDDSDLHKKKNWRGQTGEDPVPSKCIEERKGKNSPPPPILEDLLFCGWKFGKD